MIRAPKMLAVSIFVLTDDRAAVTTAIDQPRHRAIREAGDDDGVLADIGGLVIALLGDFAGMGKKHPCLVEDHIHLHVEDVLIGIDRPVHRVVSDQASDILHQNTPSFLFSCSSIAANSGPTSSIASRLMTRSTRRSTAASLRGRLAYPALVRNFATTPSVEIGRAGWPCGASTR